MSDYNKCPRCGYPSNACTIKKCDDCGTVYCSQCPDKTVRQTGQHRSANACPNCGSNYAKSLN